MALFRVSVAKLASKITVKTAKTVILSLQYNRKYMTEYINNTLVFLFFFIRKKHTLFHNRPVARGSSDSVI